MTISSDICVYTVTNGSFMSRCICIYRGGQSHLHTLYTLITYMGGGQRVNGWESIQIGLGMKNGSSQRTLLCMVASYHVYGDCIIHEDTGICTCTYHTLQTMHNQNMK